MIETEFELKTFNNLLDKLKTSENSVVLLLPQIFNIKVGDYIEDIKIDEIKSIKEDYNTFVFKIAEMPNLIPIIFLYDEKDKKSIVDLSKYFYFKELKHKFNLKKYNYIRVISKKLWYSINDVAFYEEFDEYPFKIPLLYKYNENILINAALEAIRRYYKLPKTQIKYENGNLIIGNIINIPITSDSSLIINKYRDYPKIYSVKEILNIDKDKINDKIIIIKSNNNTIQTMQSLATVIESLMNKNFIRYNKNADYFLIAILAIVLFFILWEIRFLAGFIVILAMISIEFFFAIYLIHNNVYFDYMLYFCVFLSVFFSVCFSKMLKNKKIFNARKNLIIKYVSPAKIKKYLNQNIDIKIRNAWLKTKSIYIVFENSSFFNPEKLKITFEKIKTLIYNNIDLCMIKTNNFNELFIVLIEEIDLNKEIDLLFKIRKSIEGTNYNIIVNDTEIYFLEYNNDIIFIDRKYNIKSDAENIEKKGYILIQEDDIQKYISLIKFQKIPSSGSNMFFNAVSER